MFSPEGVVIDSVRARSAKRFNYRRKGLQHLLERALRGDLLHIVVTTPDRLSRIARSEFELIKHFIELSGGHVSTLENTANSGESFDTHPLVGFITRFYTSYYGKRSAKQSRQGLQKDPVLPSI